MKLDVDTLATVPTVPPAAGPDRAFDPPLPNPGRPEAAAAEVVVGAVAELLLAVALTMPYAPPAIAMAVAAKATNLLSRPENMD